MNYLTNQRNSPILVKILIVFTILVAMDFYSYIYLPSMRIAHFMVTFICVFIIIFGAKGYKKSFIDVIVIWTIATIFLSIIPAIIDYNQSFYQTFIACVNLSYSLFLYFVLKQYKVEVNFLIKTITIICFVWVILELGQQFTYPSFLFSGRYVSHGAIEVRMGLYRFYIWGVDLVMLAFAYMLSSLASKNKTFNVSSFIFAIIFFAGLLCYGSRKHIFAVLFVFGLFAIKSRRSKIQWLMILVLVISVFVCLFSFFYEDFYQLNLRAEESQGTGEDFIRYMAANYYLFDFSNSNLYPIFGAGLDVPGSILWKKLQYAQNIYGDMIGYWQADVGIIGYYSKFGLLGVSAIFMYIGYFVKNWKYIDEWLKYFFIMKVLLIVFDFWAIWDVGMMAYSLFLYLLDSNINKNKFIANKQLMQIIRHHNKIK